MAKRAPKVTAAVPPTPRLIVEYVDIDTLLGWPGNPKEHDVGAIAESVRRFGFRDPIGVNRRNNEIEEGHGRLKTVRAFRQQHLSAPPFILVDASGKWLAPVIFFDDDEITQHGWTLAHNKTQDLGGGYDEHKLFEALRAQAGHGVLLGTGFDGDDIDALRRKLEGGDGTSVSGLGASTQFQILLTCTDETQQSELLERFTREGLTVRAIMR